MVIIHNMLMFLTKMVMDMIKEAIQVIIMVDMILVDHQIMEAIIMDLTEMIMEVLIILEQQIITIIVIMETTVIITVVGDIFSLQIKTCRLIFFNGKELI